MSAPFTPEQLAASVKYNLHNNEVLRVVVQTHYGSEEMEVREMWFAADTKTLHLAVLPPQGHDIVKL